MADYKAISQQITRDMAQMVATDARAVELHKLSLAGLCNYDDANEYARIISGYARKAFEAQGLTFAERLTFAEALDLVSHPAKDIYTRVIEICQSAQNAVNKAAGIGLKSVDVAQPDVGNAAVQIAQNDAGGVIKSVSEQLEQYGLRVVDESVRANADFHESLGFSPKVIRTYEGAHLEHTDHKRPNWADCEWCRSLAGEWDYSDVKKAGNEVWKRHEGCRCTIVYQPSKKTFEKMRANGNSFAGQRSSPEAIQVRNADAEKRAIRAQERIDFVDQMKRERGWDEKTASIYFNQHLDTLSSVSY